MLYTALALVSHTIRAEVSPSQRAFIRGRREAKEGPSFQVLPYFLIAGDRVTLVKEYHDNVT